MGDVLLLSPCPPGAQRRLVDNKIRHVCSRQRFSLLLAFSLWGLAAAVAVASFQGFRKHHHLLLFFFFFLGEKGISVPVSRRHDRFIQCCSDGAAWAMSVNSKWLPAVVLSWLVPPSLLQGRHHHFFFFFSTLSRLVFSSFSHSRRSRGRNGGGGLISSSDQTNPASSSCCYVWNNFISFKFKSSSSSSCCSCWLWIGLRVARERRKPDWRIRRNCRLPPSRQMEEILLLSSIYSRRRWRFLLWGLGARSDYYFANATINCCCCCWWWWRWLFWWMADEWKVNWWKWRKRDANWFRLVLVGTEKGRQIESCRQLCSANRSMRGEE